MTVYVGLDLSLTAAGTAIIIPGNQTTVIITKSKATGPLLEDRGRRLQDHAAAILAPVFSLYGSEGPDGGYVVAIEAPPYGATLHQGSAWDRAYLWWLVVSRFLGVNPISEVSPTAVKAFATSRGNASKPEMMARAAQEFPGVDFIDDNGCDALWLAAMAQSHHNPETPIVAPHGYRTKSLKSVSW